MLRFAAAVYCKAKVTIPTEGRVKIRGFFALRTFLP